MPKKYNCTYYVHILTIVLAILGYSSKGYTVMLCINFVFVLSCAAYTYVRSCMPLIIHVRGSNIE